MTSAQRSEIDVAAVLAGVDLVDVIKPYVDLKKKNKTWLGCCPFHDEKTPSFHVNAVKQFYHCYGCGESGDAIHFVRKKMNLNFVEACEHLAGGSLVRVDQAQIDASVARRVEIERLAAEEQAATWETIAQKAAGLWAKCRPVDVEHPYLVVKGIRGYGLRQLRNMLVAPVRDAEGKLWSLQFIQVNGVKTFLTDGKAQGCYSACGKPSGVVLVTEGIATRNSLVEATGHACVAAYSAGNLLPVAVALRAKFPNVALVLCADNDQWKPDKGNPGVEFATKAAAAVGGLLAIPEFDDLHSQPSDFNDLHRQEGTESVRAIIDAVLRRSLPVPAPAPLQSERAAGSAPKPPRVTPMGPGPVDITAENERRLAYERQIEDAGFDVLVYTLFPEIESSGLLTATREMLVKRIAKKAGVSVVALRAGSGDLVPAKPGRSGADEWLPELNGKHAVVTQNGATRILCIDYDPVFKRRVVCFSGRQDFVMRYENRETYLNGERSDVGTAWLKNPQRRELLAVAFLPGADLGADIYNLWEGFTIAAELRGSCDRFLGFVRDIVCMGCDETFSYVWGWMAHLIQRPAELPGTALVLRGQQGVGKNTFVEALAQLANPAHYVALTCIEHLTGRFSAHRAGALLVFANEASWGGDKSSEGALKALVTDTDTLLEAKHKDALKVRNFARLIVATNSDWPVPRDEDDRRFIVLDVDPAHKEDGGYFRDIKAELENGGYETLMHLLTETDITGWHPRTVPRLLKERGWDMKIRSGGSITEWWLECLEEGFVCAEAYMPRNWRTQILTRDVQEAYAAWCRRRGYAHILNIHSVGSALARWGCKRIRPGSGNSRPWMYAMPELDQARAAFAEALAIPAQWWTEG